MQSSAASRTSLLLSAFSLAAGATLLGACGSDGQECRFGADCESNQCTADGLCVAPDGSSGSSGASSSSGAPNTSSSASGGSSGGGSSSGGASSSSGSSGVGCVANLDGIIDKEEVPQAAGLIANFRFANDVAVDMAGVLEDGVRKWDLSGPYEGDRNVLVETRPVAGSWYASGFPTGQYSALLGEPRSIPNACTVDPVVAPATLGVLRADNDSLSLLGFVSASDGQPASEETNIVYDKPITTLKFPLAVGASWETANAYATGKLKGSEIPLYGKLKDTYSSNVAASGVLVTPNGIFPVLKVVTTFTRTTDVGLGYNVCLHSTSKAVAFVTECGGTIAKVTSNENEASDDFTAAAQVQRLAPAQ